MDTRCCSAVSDRCCRVDSGLRPLGAARFTNTSFLEEKSRGQDKVAPPSLLVIFHCKVLKFDYLLLCSNNHSARTVQSDYCWMCSAARHRLSDRVELLWFTVCDLTFYSCVLSYETLSAEMESLRRHLSQVDSPTVLCHNDLLTKNIIYNRKDGEKPPIRFKSRPSVTV